MGDTVGTATLVLDADTSKFIVEMARAHQATQKITEGVKETHAPMGKFLEVAKHVSGELFQMSIPLTGVAATVAVIEAGFERWRERIRETREIMVDVAHLNQAIIASGRGPETKDIREAITAATPGIDEKARVDLYKAYTGAGGNTTATVGAIGQMAKSANDVAAIGRDPVAFAKLMGGLDFAKVDHSEDVANYLMQNAGDNADRALQVIQKNPAQAEDIAKLFAAAVRGGKGSMSLMNKLAGDFMSRGGKGSLAQFVRRSGRAIAGREGADDLKLLLNAQGPEIQHGQLAGEAAQARQDPEAGSLIYTKEIEGRSREIEAEDVGAKALRKTRKEAEKEALSRLPFGTWLRARSQIFFNNEGDSGISDADLRHELLTKALEQHDELKQQSDLMRDADAREQRRDERDGVKRLIPNRHGENSP